MSNLENPIEIKTSKYDKIAIYKWRSKPGIKQKLKTYKKEWVKRNKEKLIKYHIEYNKLNKEKIKERHRKKVLSNPVIYKEQRKKQRAKHLEKYRKYAINYYRQNKEKMNQESRVYRKNNKERINKYYLLYRRGYDNRNREVARLRCLAYNAFQNYSKNGKQYSSKKYGINYTKIFKYIGKCPGERNQWHIDHIIPLSLFNFDRMEDVKEAFKPSNHRWILAKENRIKQDKIYLNVLELE